jgi:hypothetical protein
MVDRADQLENKGMTMKICHPSSYNQAARRLRRISQTNPAAARRPAIPAPATGLGAPRTFSLSFPLLPFFI